MKTLLLVGVIAGFAALSGPTVTDAGYALAQGYPPLPDQSCRWVTDYAVRCHDRFGNLYTCNLRQQQGFRRWECA